MSKPETEPQPAPERSGANGVRRNRKFTPRLAAIALIWSAALVALAFFGSHTR